MVLRIVRGTGTRVRRTVIVMVMMTMATSMMIVMILMVMRGVRISGDTQVFFNMQAKKSGLLVH